MDNPFRKRASENIDKSDAFLRLVSPEPIEMVLDGRVDELYDRLIYIFGTPGSGKTTLGRLFEFKNLQFLADQHRHAVFRGMAKTLNSFGALKDNLPSVMAARLAMDAEYRGILELPYANSIKSGLLKGLIQARCVLFWLRELAHLEINDERVRIVLEDQSPAAESSIGAQNVASLREMAIEVEKSIYDVIHSLVPKSVDSFGTRVTDPYEPLKYISRLEILGGHTSDDQPQALRPMLILDDIHNLHPTQFSDISHWLLDRKFGSARWIMGRMDNLSGSSAFSELRPYALDYDMPGFKRDRDYAVLFTDQGGTGKAGTKRTFLGITKDVSRRYLEQMPIFRNKMQTDLSVLLQERSVEPSASVVKSLQEEALRTAESLRITTERVSQLRQLVSDYSSAKEELEDVRLKMLIILMHRYAKRTKQQSLFDEVIDAEPSKPLSADISVLDGARVQLLHQHDRPFYYGFEDIAGASGNNVEQFLQMAGALVDQLELRMVRKKDPTLDAVSQHKIVKDVAEKAINDWQFPLRDQVLKLVSHIAESCVSMSTAPNAPLGAGANAYGVPQTEFLAMGKKHPRLEQVLHYAIAYNAIRVERDYNCKGVVWTLLVLGSYPTIKSGLTFKSGGFVEGTTLKLDKVLSEVSNERSF